ncbi:MAG: hypothetical protein HS116_04155 [Planctomycetes bacterium]|nr:hypothetical protein [Planctomycetota bacterium]
MAQELAHPIRQLVMLALRWSLLVSLTLMILVVSGILLAVNYYGGQQIAEELSGQYLHKTGDLVEQKLVDFFQPVVKNLLNAQKWAKHGVVKPEDVKGSNAVYIPILEEYDQVTSIATGDADGYSYRLGAEKENFQSRISDASKKDALPELALWSPDGELLKSWTDKKPFDARDRPWYLGAMENYKRAGQQVHQTEIYWSDPFILRTSKSPGIAASLPYEHPSGKVYVMTFNLMLTKLSDFTASLHPSPNGKAFVLSEQGAVIGFPADPRYATSEARALAVKGDSEELPKPEELDIPDLMAAAKLWLGQGKPNDQVLAFDSGGERWRVIFRRYRLPFRQTPTSVIWMGMMVPERDFLEQAKRQQRNILAVSAGALALAMLLAFGLARIYAQPLRKLAEQSEKITELDLRPGQPIRTHVLETYQLAESQERMRTALDSFARYIPTEVVRELLRRGEAARIGARACEVTVMFSDVRGFTTISERMTPEALTAHMADYFESLMNLIILERGTIDKMIGDAIMALWGAPVDDKNHARNAVRACLRCQLFLKDFNEKCKQDGRPPLITGFGLSSGIAMVGNMGAPARLNYTAIGDIVNLASRLEGTTKMYGTGILCSEATKDQAGPGFEWRLVDLVAVKGKTMPVKVYEPLGPVGAVDQADLDFARAYEAAFHQYLKQDFAGALDSLDGARKIRPEDVSLHRLAVLCREYLEAPPGKDWDGVERLKTK